MTPIKQTVYLPVKVKNELPQESGYYHSLTKIHYFDKDDSNHQWYSNSDKKYATFPKFWLKPQEAFVFTSEQLNQLLSEVIKDTLNTAAEKATLKEYQQGDWDVCWISNDMGDAYVLDKESITNTFEEIFKKFEV